MKTRFAALIGAQLLAASALAQSSFAQFPHSERATEAVESFYRFDVRHDQSFSAQQIEARSRFFTPRLRRLFWAELKRAQLDAKKHPTDKPYFDELPFQPIEFNARDYRVGAAQIRRQRASVNASVNVSFVYGKSSPTSHDGTPVSYRILLAKRGGEWLIDDVIYDDATRLSAEFAKTAKFR